MTHSSPTPISYGAHTQALFRLGIPIVLGQFGTIAQAFADTIMVGQYGTADLSAAGFVNQIFNLAIFFLLGFSYSTTPIVGSYVGRQQPDRAGRTLRESLLTNLLTCLAVMACMGVLFLNVHRLGQPAELLPLIRPYFLVVLASLPFVSGFNALKQFCDGVGDTRTPMWIMVAGNALNILGNYVLIFGMPAAGIPPLGVVGAGLATLLSRIVMLIWLAVVVRRHPRYAAYRVGFGLSLTRKGCLHLTRLGLPISLQLSLEASSFNIAAVMMGWIGVNALAAHQVMCTIGTFCFLFYYGVGAAAAIRISHFRGRAQVAPDAATAAAEWGEVRRTAFAAYRIVLVAAALMVGAIWLLREPICYAFTSSPDVVALCLTMMFPFFLYQVGDSMQTIFANALRAIEVVRPLMWGAVVAYLLVSLPASYAFAFLLHGGARGVWFGFPLGLTTAGLIFLAFFLRRTRRR